MPVTDVDRIIAEHKRDAIETRERLARTDWSKLEALAESVSDTKETNIVRATIRPLAEIYLNALRSEECLGRLIEIGAWPKLGKPLGNMLTGTVSWFQNLDNAGTPNRVQQLSEITLHVSGKLGENFHERLAAFAALAIRQQSQIIASELEHCKKLRYDMEIDLAENHEFTTRKHPSRNERSRCWNLSKPQRLSIVS